MAAALQALLFCDHITASARYCVITSQPVIPQALVCLSHLRCLQGWQQHSSHMAACQFSGLHNLHICTACEHTWHPRCTTPLSCEDAWRDRFVTEYAAVWQVEMQVEWDGSAAACVAASCLTIMMELSVMAPRQHYWLVLRDATPARAAQLCSSSQLYSSKQCTLLLTIAIVPLCSVVLGQAVNPRPSELTYNETFHQPVTPHLSHHKKACTEARTCSKKQS